MRLSSPNPWPPTVPDRPLGARPFSARRGAVDTKVEGPDGALTAANLVATVDLGARVLDRQVRITPAQPMWLPRGPRYRSRGSTGDKRWAASKAHSPTCPLPEPVHLSVEGTQGRARNDPLPGAWSPRALP